MSKLISYDINRTIFNFFKIKISIKPKCRKRVLKNFFQHSIVNNTILLVEINDCHKETLIGYYRYLKDLGYNVEIIVNQTTENVFSACNENIKIWKLNYNEINQLLTSNSLKKYQYVIFNSKIIYYSSKDNDIHTLLPMLKQGQHQNIYVQHHINKINDYPEDKQIILANPQNLSYLKNKIVNPHYFGDIKITQKNDLTHFITVGNIEKERKNTNLLINTVNNLKNEGFKNFKITVIGNGKLNSIPKDIQKFFDIKGKLDFKKMYNKMEEADFFLPLLDPENELHERYLKDGTSRSFQLIYGFLKPCIIAKKFANAYNFTDENSLIYEKNSDLSDCMKKAINMTNIQYCSIQRKLKYMALQIEQLSFENMEKLLNV